MYMKYQYFEDEKRIFDQTIYSCFTASFKFTILKGRYLQNEKVSEAPILTGLYWEYICSIGDVNWHIKNMTKIGGYVPLRSKQLEA